MNESIEQILFEYKNKDYGAFVLRRKNKFYGYLGVFSSLLIVAFLFILTLIMVPKNESKNDTEIRQVAVEITPLKQEKPKPIQEDPLPLNEPEKEIPKPVSKVATKKFLIPELKPDDQVIEEELIPTVEDLKSANPGKETIEGTTDIHNIYDPKAKTDTGQSGSGSGHGKKTESVFHIVEKQPEFPGGTQALQKYLQENLRYPKPALTAEISGTVYIQFVVDSRGNIRDPIIMRDIGGGCGEEALRVITNMPRWKPGQQGGQKVSVRYALPIRFTISHP